MNLTISPPLHKLTKQSSKKQAVTLTCLLSFSACLVTIPNFVMANSISMAYGGYQDTLYIGENRVELEPMGVSVFAQFNVNDAMTLNASYSKFDDNNSFNDIANVDLENQNIALGISYNWQDWLVFVDYSDTDEDVKIQAKSRDIRFYDEEYRAPAWSIGISHGDFIGDFDSATASPWYWSISAKTLYTDWERDTKRVSQPLQDPIIKTGKDAGDSWFASVGISLSQYMPTSGDAGFNYGGSLSWHHLISGESGIVSRNGRSISQISASRQLTSSQQSNFSQKVSGDQYGIVAIFFGYSLNNDFSIEFDTSTSVAADENSASINLSANYYF